MAWLAAILQEPYLYTTDPILNRVLLQPVTLQQPLTSELHGYIYLTFYTDSQLFATPPAIPTTSSYTTNQAHQLV